MTEHLPTKPLASKLGYKIAEKVHIQGTPPDWLPAHLIEQNAKLTGTLPAEWVHIFVTQKSELANYLKDLDLSQVTKGLWISWPKKKAGNKSHLTEQALRDAILPLGWVDTKVVAVDDTWSGLKFHKRKG